MPFKFNSTRGFYVNPSRVEGMITYFEHGTYSVSSFFFGTDSYKPKPNFSGQSCMIQG